MSSRPRPDGYPPQLVSEESDDAGPSSNVRPLESSGPRCILSIATRLRGSDAEAAQITVTDETGAVRYEGPLGNDGALAIVLDGVRGPVRVLLETARWHRQADVLVDAGRTTEHAFA